MPKIQEYESQINPNGEDTSKQAEGSRIGIGQGLSALGQGIEQAGEGYKSYQDRHQTIMADAQFSDGKLKAETLNNNRTESFDPDDPEAIANVLKPVDDMKDSIVANLNSTAAVEYVSKKFDTYRDAYLQSALHKNSQLIAQETGAAVKTASTSYTGSAYQNPDLLDANIDQAKNFVQNLPGGQGHKDEIQNQMTRAIVLGAGQGMVRDNPDRVLKELDSGTKFDSLNSTDQESLRLKATSAITARERNAQLNEKKAENVQKQQQLQNFKDIYHQVDDGQMDFKTLDQHWTQGMISDKQHELATNRLQSIMDGTMQSDPNAFMDAQRRLRLPDGDPNKITDFEHLTSEYGQGKGKGLSQQNVQFLSKTFLVPKGTDSTENQMWGRVMDDAQKKLIQPTFVPWGDRPGMANYGKALTAIRADYDTKIKQGLSPTQLLDPNSKDYVGQAITSFQRSRAEMNAQAIQMIHAPAKTATNIGGEVEAPAGSNPQQTPISNPVSTQPKTAPVLTPKQQAALDAITSKFGKKGS